MKKIVILLLVLPCLAQAYTCNIAEVQDNGAAAIKAQVENAQNLLLAEGSQSTQINFTDIIPAVGCSVIRAGAEMHKTSFFLAAFIYLLIIIHLGMTIYKVLVEKNYKEAGIYIATMFILLIIIKMDYVHIIIQPLTNAIFFTHSIMPNGVTDLLGAMLLLVGGFVIGGVSLFSFLNFATTLVLGSSFVLLGLFILYKLVAFLISIFNAYATIFLSFALLFFFGHFILAIGVFPATRKLLHGYFTSIKFQLIEMVILFSGISICTSIIKSSLFAITAGNGTVDTLVEYIKTLEGLTLGSGLVYYLGTLIITMVFLFAIMEVLPLTAQAIASTLTGGQSARNTGGALGNAVTQSVINKAVKTGSAYTAQAGGVIAGIAKSKANLSNFFKR